MHFKTHMQYWTWCWVFLLDTRSFFQWFIWGWQAYWL